MEAVQLVEPRSEILQPLADPGGAIATQDVAAGGGKVIAAIQSADEILPEGISTAETGGGRLPLEDETVPPTRSLPALVREGQLNLRSFCLLYTSDAADDLLCV